MGGARCRGARGRSARRGAIGCTRESGAVAGRPRDGVLPSGAPSSAQSLCTRCRRQAPGSSFGVLQGLHTPAGPAGKRLTASRAHAGGHPLLGLGSAHGFGGNGGTFLGSAEEVFSCSTRVWFS